MTGFCETENKVIISATKSKNSALIKSIYWWTWEGETSINRTIAAPPPPLHQNGSQWGEGGADGLKLGPIHLRTAVNRLIAHVSVGPLWGSYKLSNLCAGKWSSIAKLGVINDHCDLCDVRRAFNCVRGPSIVIHTQVERFWGEQEVDHNFIPLPLSLFVRYLTDLCLLYDQWLFLRLVDIKILGR